MSNEIRNVGDEVEYYYTDPRTGVSVALYRLIPEAADELYRLRAELAAERERAGIA